MILALMAVLVFPFQTHIPSGVGIVMPEQEMGDGRAVEKWTVLSYMNGEGDLEKFITGDLNEMEQIGSSDSVDIVVQIDLGDGGNPPRNQDPFETWTETRRYHVEYHPEDGIGSTRLDGVGSLPVMGEVDMDDPESLRDFLEWGLSAYPADHYMIAIEGHGGGPADGLMEDPSSSGSDKKMYVYEMGAAIRNAIDNTIGVPVDIISFDICWMGMAEAAAEIMDHSRYMVGSFDEIPGAGWPYDRCLKRILNDTSLTLKQRLKGVVEEFMDYYDPSGGNSYMSLAAIDLMEFRERLLPAIADLGEELFFSDPQYNEIYNSLMPLIDNPRKKDDNEWDRYIDLYQFAELLSMDQRVPLRVREAAAGVISSEDQVLIYSDGGSDHPSSSRLFGIFYPTIRNQQNEYSPLVLSDLSAWDELAALRVEELAIEASGVNWTDPNPGSIRFELRTITPSLVNKVELQTILNGIQQNESIIGTGGMYAKTLDVSGFGSIQYRYLVTGKYGNVIEYPPDGFSEARFERESEPPEIWHHVTQSISLSSSDPGLTVFIRDETGLDTEIPARIPRIEYRETGTESWFSVPLAEMGYDRFRGWVEYMVIPTGIPSRTELEYHFLASDVYGNQARFPDEGEASTTMAEGKRFYLDGYRSSLQEHNLLVERFTAMGMSLTTGLGSNIPDLSGYKGYILIQPQEPLDGSDASRILAFHQGGGELMIVLDPNDGDQIVNARWIMEEIGLEVTTEGYVNGFYPSSPSSDLGDDLPSIAGTSQGSLIAGEGMNIVFYTSPPGSALLTGWYGMGKSVISIPSILDDQVMELASNRLLSELLITFLQENNPPEISHSVEPQGVLVPDQVFELDLSGSFDRDGIIESYSVTFSDNTHMEGLDPVFSHSFQTTGSYTAVIEVSDKEGASSSITISFKVNRPPGTELGVSGTMIHAGDTVVFDYKGSDPDGDEVYVLWEFGDGFKVSGRTVSHTYNLKGTYTFKLIARDSNGLERNRTGTIEVENSIPVAIIDKASITVNSGPGNFSGSSMVTLKVREGDVIVFPGDLSQDNDVNDELNLTWDMGDGTLLYGIEALHSFQNSGLFEVVLTIDDGHGGVSNTTMKVSIENRPPFAMFKAKDLGNGKVSFDASQSTDDAWDLAGLVFIWDFGDGNEKRTREPRIEYRYSFGGRFDVQLRVEDEDGGSDTYESEINIDGMTFFEVITISLVVLAILGTAGVVGILFLRRRMIDEGKGLKDYLRKDERTELGSQGSFSRPTDPGPAGKPGHSHRTAPDKDRYPKSSSQDRRFDRT